LFERRAQLLNSALVLLAGWMDQAPLSKDDVAVLAQVGVSFTARFCADG